MTFVPKKREFKLTGILLIMIAVMAPPAFAKVILGIYGGGRLSGQLHSPPEYSWQTDVTRAGRSHLAFFIQFYNQRSHWSICLETLDLKYNETYGVYHTQDNPTMDTFPKEVRYYGVSLEYSIMRKADQRLVPFVGFGIMADPLANFLGGHGDYPPGIDVKADLGLKYRISDFVDLRAQAFFALGNKLLAGSLGIDFVF
jgi:hypothetical protein